MGDRGYHKKNWTFDTFEKEGDLGILMQKKKPPSCTQSKEQKTFDQLLFANQAVAPPFRVVKLQFGYAKVQYRHLAKNSRQIVTPFALRNL